MNYQKSGSRTLLWSVIMSSPGPLVVGLGLLVGQSSTQIADFVRRSSELLAIILSFAVYKVTTAEGKYEEEKRKRLERMTGVFVGTMMCLGGSIMLMLAFASKNEEKGNMIPGLVIALLGVIANTIFWQKYKNLNKSEPNEILAAQARLYRAKSLVDGCVTIALLTVAIAPGTRISVWVDMIGSAIVAVYLVFCGIETIKGK